VIWVVVVHSYLKFAEGKYQRIRRETHRPEIVGIFRKSSFEARVGTK
jgi:hypothetical protein